MTDLLTASTSEAMSWAHGKMAEALWHLQVKGEDPCDGSWHVYIHPTLYKKLLHHSPVLHDYTKTTTFFGVPYSVLPGLTLDAPLLLAKQFKCDPQPWVRVGPRRWKCPTCGCVFKSKKQVDWRYCPACGIDKQESRE